ncbi:hypothetical protein AX16_001798 [Volvariella volvacea WC 439]|nr:hypothetical protein AX16_002248 [Volvariella volvacea WC 439]KAF8659695.1 hypothetical protein AX16_001798 [Volvariella volvacea WC 439]
MMEAETAHSGFIPIIDLSDISNPDVELRKALAEKIRRACVEVGFFYVKNHGIPEELVENTIKAGEKFFDLPLEAKMEIENKKSPNFMGYSPFLSGNNNPDNAGDMQEGFEFSWEPIDKLSKDRSQSDEERGVLAGANQWPTGVEGFRETVLQYYHAAVALGKAMFPMFALALHLPEDWFADKTKNSAAMMRILHYPTQTGTPDDRVIGIGAHTDWECFTILWQQPGIQALQVRDNENKWVDAPSIPGTLLINLGDQLARWSNDTFKSTVHRAMNRSGARRYSIPLFFGTDYNVRLEPIPGCVSEDRPYKYDVITAGEYLKSRFVATYGH